ncbi:hypothetical protein HCN56_13585, partial [Streptomyces lonarensis]|nr:hypothetical protein [Streptomyces lonarensis]
MHPSEPFRPQQPGRHRHIPGMRPSFEPAVGHSATPIYDALCAEYRRMFRTLPGDRSGEEELRFDAFGTFGSPRTAVAGWESRVPTGKLNAFLGELVASHPHP